MKRIGLMAASKDIDYVKILSGLVLALATTVGTLGLSRTIHRPPPESRHT